MNTLVTVEEIAAAERAIAGLVERTPSIKSPALSTKLGARVRDCLLHDEPLVLLLK